MTSMRLSSISIRRTTVRMISCMPNSIEIIEPFGHLRRKVFQAADHEGEVALGLCRLESGLMPLLQLRQALFQARDAWLELRFVDDALGITVDEPTNPASQTGHLPIEANDLVRHGGAVARLVNATAIFVSHSMRFFQESPHLIPYHLFQLVAAYGAVIAHRLATEPVTVRTGATIVAQGVHRIVFA